MKESYLHLIWETKRLPFHLMQLSDQSNFELIDTGTYNRSESGPDFLNAKIRLDDLLWVGGVEIHVRASDWYRHEHQNDRSYDNVILHVVLENDMDVIQNGRLLPCLELKDVLDEAHYLIFGKREPSHEIPCKSSFHSIDPIFLTSMIDRVVIDRFERKCHEIKEMNIVDSEDILIRLMAKSFGSKVNSLPFDELATRLSNSTFKSMNHLMKQRMVCQISGVFLPNDENQLLSSSKDLLKLKRENIGMVNPSSWKLKGVRPASFPDRRVRQFASVVSLFNFDLLNDSMSPTVLHSLILAQFDTINQTIPDPLLRMSRGFIDLIIINCFVPFVFWQGKVWNRPDVCQNAFELLDMIASEDNHIVRYWKKLGFKAKSALDSQGLLELHRHYCIKKKCLSCAVGNKLLTR